LSKKDAEFGLSPLSNGLIVTTHRKETRQHALLGHQPLQQPQLYHRSHIVALRLMFVDFRQRQPIPNLWSSVSKSQWQQPLDTHRLRPGQSHLDCRRD
jgi:hypothetical protein